MIYKYKAVIVVVISLVMSISIGCGREKTEQINSGVSDTGSLQVKIVFPGQESLSSVALYDGVYERLDSAATDETCLVCDRIKFTVSGPDMTAPTTVSEDYSRHFALITDIPAGTGRSLTVEIFNTSGTTVYSNLSNPSINITILAGKSSTVQVDLVPESNISLSVGFLVFDARVGDPAPDQTFDLSNATEGTVNFDIADDATWLSVNTISGSIAANTVAETITVSATCENIGPGSHNGKVTVTDPNAANKFETLDVLLDCEDLPKIGFSPQGFQLSAPVGLPATPQTLSITNIGGGTLIFMIEDDQTWLNVDQVIGLSDGDTNDATMTADCTSLIGGSYIGTISVHHNGTDPLIDTPVDINVYLTCTVIAQPTIGLDQTTMNFAAIAGSMAAPQTLSVSNTGTGTLNYTIDDDSGAAWLTASPLSGSSTGETDPITVNADCTSLVAGIYNGAITVTDAAATNSPQTVNVSLDCTLGPTINLDQTSFTINADVGAVALDQTLNVSNSGGGTLNYSITDNAAWLTVNPTQGSSTGEQDPIAISASCVSLAPGDYSGIVTITATGATNSPQTVSVSLTCTGCPNPNKIGSDVRITNDAAASSWPNITWTGSEYGVVWYDNRTGGTHVYFTRISSTGSKIIGDIKVSTSGSQNDTPSIAWSGSEYGIVYYSGDMMFARLDSTGSTIGAPNIVSAGGAPQGLRSIVWTGSEYGVVYRLGDEVTFARINASTGLREGSEILIDNSSTNIGRIQLAWTGSEFGVVWDDTSDLYFAKVDSAGTILQAPNTVMASSVNRNGISYNAAANEFIVVTHNSGLKFFRLDATDGSLKGPITNIADHTSDIWSWTPPIVISGSEFGVMWHQYWDANPISNADIFYRRVDSTGNPIGGEINISNGAGESQNGAMVWNGNEIGVVWAENRDGNYEIYFARIGCQ